MYVNINMWILVCEYLCMYLDYYIEHIYLCSMMHHTGYQNIEINSEIGL